MRKELKYVYRCGDECYIPSIGKSAKILGTVFNTSMFLKNGDMVVLVEGKVSGMKDKFEVFDWETFDFNTHFTKGNDKSVSISQSDTILLIKEENIELSNPGLHNLKRGTTLEIGITQGSPFLATIKYTTQEKIFTTRGLGRKGMSNVAVITAGYRVVNSRFEQVIQKELGF